MVVLGDPSDVLLRAVASFLGRGNGVQIVRGDPVLVVEQPVHLAHVIDEGPLAPCRWLGFEDGLRRRR